MKSKLSVRQQIHSVLQIYMKTLRLFLISAALLLGASLSFVVRAQSTSTKQMAPDTLVANLYRQQRQVFQQARSRVLLDKYFDKSLADLTWKELLRWESSESEEDFDYVLYNFGYGEGTITKLVIGKPSYEGRKAQVNVSYDVVYAPPDVPKRSVYKETIIFLLSAGETGWKITDIKYDGGKKSLFEMYSKDFKGTDIPTESNDNQSLSSPPNYDVWAGTYEYGANLGRTSGGTVVFIEYTIEISSGNGELGAVISASGYQTDDEVRCDTKTEGKRINLYFNSYPDGGTANQYGVALYKKGELLLTLETISVRGKTGYKVYWGSYSTSLSKQVTFKKTK